MRHLVEDETGGKWVVMPEDPAWWAVKELRREMEYVVLTSTMIRTGQAADGGDIVDEALPGVAEAYEKSGSPALGRSLARFIRLRLCLNRIGNGP